jgi:hypothetical protein
MWTTDSMKKRPDSLLISRINERLITRPGNRLCERLIKKPYIRLSGLPDGKTARCMYDWPNIQTVSHSNVQTFKRLFGQPAECNYGLPCSLSASLLKV